MEAKRVIKLDDDDDEDDDYLFSMAAVEADVLASKRRRISLPSENVAASNPSEREGLYMAALKGDQSFVRSRAAAAAGSRSDVVVSGAVGDCFKCGKPGHWARDCGGGGQLGNFAGGGGGGGSGSDPDIAEKSCPCGLGICLVLTANTERNRGRKFYKCPQRQENGGCGFFEWTDGSSGGSNSVAGTGRSYGDESLYPGLECPCGAGFCVILTAKTGKNVGQQFYRCPANQGSSCGFFKWCNENAPSATASKPVYNSTDSSYTAKTGSDCFKCGKVGHWARDCPSSSSNSQAQAQLAGNSAQSGTCYKCGKLGHWSRDCTSS